MEAHSKAMLDGVRVLDLATLAAAPLSQRISVNSVPT
jgi:crotonobetainyl-CoA:carnitine CoA-transferase CaiB-like acyl-CoA transferase